MTAIFGKDVEKITVYSNDSAAAKELRAYFESLTDKICFDSSLPGDGNMEMTKIGVDKGTALKTVNCDSRKKARQRRVFLRFRWLFFLSAQTLCSFGRSNRRAGGYFFPPSRQVF